MDKGAKEILKEFKQTKITMEKETLENLSNQINTVFIDSTKQFFKNLKFYMIIGSSCLSVLGTAFVMHYIR